MTGGGRTGGCPDRGGQTSAPQAEEIVALADKTLRSFQAPQEEISGEIAIGGGETDAMRLVARPPGP